MASEERSDLGSLLRLAGPLVLAYAGNNMLGFVDTAMVGRLGAASLAAVSMGNGIFFALCLFGMGVVNGMDPLAAQAVGAGEHERAHAVLAAGVRVALLLFLPIVVVVVALSFGLESIGVDRGVAVLTRSFIYGRLGNALPFFVLAALRSYLQAHRRTRAIVLSVVVANVANFVFNGLFIYGDKSLEAIGLPAIGLPAMGVFGAGLSSTLASFFSAIPMLLAVRVENMWPSKERPVDVELARKIVKLGLPIGGGILAEVALFTGTGLAAGTMGVLPAAGHNIALSLASFTFCVALGIAAATTVLVGRAVGRDDTPDARRAGFLGLGVALAFMATGAIAFVAIPIPLIRILTDQPDVIAAALPLVHVAAIFQLSDGGQVVMAAALRGVGDTKFAQVVTIIGYDLIGFPVLFVLGFAFHMGAPGLWWGCVAGLTFCAIVLGLRFDHLSKRTIARV